MEIEVIKWILIIYSASVAKMIVTPLESKNLQPKAAKEAINRSSSEKPPAVKIRIKPLQIGQFS